MKYKAASPTVALLLAFLANTLSRGSAFTLEMMGARRGKGELNQRIVGDALPSSSNSLKNPKSVISSLNQGRGQEITGVSLPSEGMYFSFDTCIIILIKCFVNTFDLLKIIIGF